MMPKDSTFDNRNSTTTTGCKGTHLLPAAGSSSDDLACRVFEGAVIEKVDRYEERPFSLSRGFSRAVGGDFW